MIERYSRYCRINFGNAGKRAKWDRASHGWGPDVLAALGDAGDDHSNLETLAWRYLGIHRSRFVNLFHGLARSRTTDGSVEPPLKRHIAALGSYTRVLEPGYSVSSLTPIVAKYYFFIATMDFAASSDSRAKSATSCDGEEISSSSGGSPPPLPPRLAPRLRYLNVQGMSQIPRDLVMYRF